MKDSIVNELITAMKDRLPPGQNLANFLTDTLCIGREAVYRRLRGEVAFTIDEVAQISCKLGISIDQIIGNHLYNRVTFDMNLLRSANAIESYYEKSEVGYRCVIKMKRLYTIKVKELANFARILLKD